MPNTATLSKNQSIPTVELIVGDAQVGSFAFFLWDPDETHPQRVPPGNATPTSFSLNVAVNSVNDLNGRALTWQGFVGAPAEGSQLFSVTVKITQDGVEVPDSPFTTKGSFQDAQFVHNALLFTVN